MNHDPETGQQLEFDSDVTGLTRHVRGDKKGLGVYPEVIASCTEAG